MILKYSGHAYLREFPQLCRRLWRTQERRNVSVESFIVHAVGVGDGQLSIQRGVRGRVVLQLVLRRRAIFRGRLGALGLPRYSLGAYAPNRLNRVLQLCQGSVLLILKCRSPKRKFGRVLDKVSEIKRSTMTRFVPPLHENLF